MVKRNHQILWWSGGSKQLPELCHLFDIRDPPDQINQEFYLPSQQKQRIYAPYLITTLVSGFRHPISGTPTDIFYVSAPYDIMQGLKTEQADINPELIETAIKPMFSKYGILIIVLTAITPIPYKLSAAPR